MAWIKDNEIRYVEGCNENNQFKDIKNLHAISTKWTNITKVVPESDDCKALGGRKAEEVDRHLQNGAKSKEIVERFIVFVCCGVHPKAIDARCSHLSPLFTC
ncbi:hypothetical protein ACHAXN_002866 [Cyclotella atomus]